MTTINSFPRVSRVKLLPEIFPPGSLRSRLPQHFKNNYLAKLEKRPDVLHQVPYEAKYRLDAETGFRIPIQDPPIRTIRPPSLDRGLFGGERVINGYIKDRPKTSLGPFTKIDDANDKKRPDFWFPNYQLKMFFSEILDRYLMVVVTETTLAQIDEASGFDAYILKTSIVDLDSRLGECLKKEMNERLLSMTAGPSENIDKQKEIYAKYAPMMLAKDEVEWLGLTLSEACAKQMAIESKMVEQRTIPLKLLLAKKVFDETKVRMLEEEEDEPSGILDRFRKK